MPAELKVEATFKLTPTTMGQNDIRDALREFVKILEGYSAKVEKSFTSTL